MSGFEGWRPGDRVSFVTRRSGVVRHRRGAVVSVRARLVVDLGRPTSIVIHEVLVAEEEDGDLMMAGVWRFVDAIPQDVADVQRQGGTVRGVQAPPELMDLRVVGTLGGMADSWLDRIKAAYARGPRGEPDRERSLAEAARIDLVIELMNPDLAAARSYARELDDWISGRVPEQA